MTKIDISEFSRLLSDLQKLKLTVGWSLTGTKATFQEFKNDTSLKGSAWDTTKQFFFEGYIPIIDGMNDPFYLLVETTEQFIHDFENEVTTESVKLDLEQLADLQARRDELQQKKEDWFHKLADVASKIPWAGQLFDDYSLFQANKKVALLEDFESFINRHGNDFSVLNNQIEQALLGLDELGKQKSFNGDQKGYQAVDFSKSNWYKKVTDYHKEHGSHIEEVQKRDIENFKEMAKVAGSAVAMDSFAMNNEIAGMAGPIQSATQDYYNGKGINGGGSTKVKENVTNSKTEANKVNAKTNKGLVDFVNEDGTWNPNVTQLISKMSRSELENSLPNGWTYENNNGFIHIKDNSGVFRIRIDPPDKLINFPHMHLYNANKQPLDINGNIVDRKSIDAHIRYE